MSKFNPNYYLVKIKLSLDYYLKIKFIKYFQKISNNKKLYEVLFIKSLRTFINKNNEIDKDSKSFIDDNKIINNIFFKLDRDIIKTISRETILLNFDFRNTFDNHIKKDILLIFYNYIDIMFNSAINNLKEIIYNKTNKKCLFCRKEIKSKISFMCNNEECQFKYKKLKQKILQSKKRNKYFNLFLKNVKKYYKIDFLI